MPGLVNNMDSDWPNLASAPASPNTEWKPIRVPRVDSIKDLNIEFELLERYYQAQELMLNNAGQPLNQRVTNLNAIMSVLRTITDLQTAIYDMERLKKFEGTLIETLKQFPNIQDAFLDAYKRALGNSFASTVQGIDPDVQ